MNDEPPDLLVTQPDLSPAFARVIHRCLEKQPERRFQSASDLAFALGAEGISNTVSKTTPSDRSQQPESPPSPPRGRQSLVTVSTPRLSWVALRLRAACGSGRELVEQSRKPTNEVWQSSTGSPTTPPIGTPL